MLSTYLHLVLSFLLLASAPVPPGEPGVTATAAPMTTREHVATAPWWPTSTSAPRSGFVGSETCAKCHGGIVRSQRTSQMAHTLVHASDASVLLSHLNDHYNAGPYTYSLAREGHDVKVRVTHASESRSAALEWAFGSGEVGQSYLWTNPDGTFREARFNYFASLNGFGATPGRLHGPPADVSMALGRQVQPFEAKTCFGCHTTGLVASAGLKETAFTPGISCEACHGPGAQHVAAMQSANSGADTHIISPAHMTPAQSVDFCGACHSTPWDVRLMGATGLQTVRFPAYRLEKSRCWGVQGDRRLTCQSCHDPHAPLERNLAAYDNACLACHATGKTAALTAEHPGKACPVAKTQCVTCHMQKYELPEMHSKFTDHMIRVARANEPLPD